MKHVAFAGNLVMLGCGSIGQGVLPLILRHIDMPRERIQILTADARGGDVAAECGVRVTIAPVTQVNYRDLLQPMLGAGDFLLNLSVDVSSVALIALCREQGALYLDTCIEPWAGGYTDPSLTPSQRSNYALRESALALAQK
jgi:homospermidine synthase